MLRFVNVTTSGLLAGSLGFGDGDRAASSAYCDSASPPDESKRYVTAIGPVALATSMTLAIGANRQPLRRTLDLLSTLSLAGVVAATLLGAPPAKRRLDEHAAVDYAIDESASVARNWSRTQTMRTALGFSAFVLSVASNVTPPSSR